ncbi:MAG: transglutaminase domain-containing protein [Chitinophagaceae bacterium]|nr:MAG: transglutaminase domain-containing protein [Chitinophagaceae bacterium]
MKRLLTLLLAGTSLLASAQTTYKGLPVLEAAGKTADYRVDARWRKGTWGFAPEAVPDVLELPVFGRTVQFGFYTGKDSILFPLSAGTVRRFYVHTTDDKYALTEVRGFDFQPLSVAAAPSRRDTFWYEQGTANPFLEQLRSSYALNDLVRNVGSDSARALRILKWTHDQWSHNGSNEPSKPDALTILREARGGKQFRCVEYGIVAASALNAVGLPARVLALKTKDVETTASGAGHVLLEVYLSDLKKWVLMDGQWDAMPVLNGVPLNAVEFQQAIARNYDALQIRSLSGTDKEAYASWIFPYLYYFDVKFDNREGPGRKLATQGGKPSLMLVPEGAKEPTVFQKEWPINNVVYTHSAADFYAAPAAVVGSR